MRGDLLGSWSFEIRGEERGRLVEIASRNRQDAPEPEVVLDPAGVAFNYEDGRRVIFPWANVVRAEYRPRGKT